MNISVVFIFQKIGENGKNFENFWSQKFLSVSYFDIRAEQISLYTSIFRACNFTWARNWAPKKMDPQSQSACPIKKTTRSIAFFFLYYLTRTCDVTLNHSSVDPYPHVTWKLKGHVELFSRQKTDLEEAPK